MANQKVIVAGSDITAKQKAEFWNKVVSGHINRENFQRFMDDADGRFDPHEFFRIREGLWRSKNFKEYILSVAKKTKKIQLSEQILGYDLSEEMNDTKIRENISKGHVFTATEACVIIAIMISRQPKGEKGNLLNNGYANIFYVRRKSNKVFVVRVHWRADGREEWRVNMFRLDDDPWCKGYRVFSRNNIFGKVVS